MAGRRTVTERVLARDYSKGFLDGVEEVLDQLEGRSRRSPQGIYRGPVPDELLSWIAGVRHRVGAEVGVEQHGDD